MKKTDQPGMNIAGDVGPMQNLESVIAMSGGDTSLNYRVMDGDRQIGLLNMRDLVRALVPVEAADPARRAASAA